MMREVNQSSLLLPTSSATRWERPDLRMPAMRDTEKSSCWAASITLARVLAETMSGRENARETVAVETPACLATSSILAFMAPPGFSKLTV